MYSSGAAKLKPKGKRKTQDPCEVCFLHRSLCICEFIPMLTLNTRVSLIIHAKELKRTTNTGTLAVKALTNSELFVRGKLNDPVDLSKMLNADYQHLMFYPSDDAIELTKTFVDTLRRPINLIVPDGNWRQASKVHYRHPEMQHIQRIKITSQNQAIQHLRAESTDYGMATLQAIAYALGFFEGAQVEEELLNLYNIKLERTLKGRGVPITNKFTEA
ncbi:MAG: DTW domain-containing protein [Bdellovibrionaceae bacterium]|nr:DTW domain-containing protein [Bdellovibrio sp.]